MTGLYRVIAPIEGRNETHPDYPLLPGDIIVREPDGRWQKHAPGLCIGGFLLTKDDEATLEQADDARWELI